MVGAGIFSLLASDSAEELTAARLGQLSLKDRNQIETPNFLAVTSRGVVPHLTPDVVQEQTQFGGVHLALEDYLEKAATAGTPPILNCPSSRSTPLHTFTALPLSLATVLAPRRIPAVSTPNGSTDDTISIFTSVGFQPLSINAYRQYVQKLRPDIAVALGDVPYGSIVGAKRIAKIADRTLSWLQLQLSDLESPSPTDSNSPSPTSTSAVFAPILPIDSHAQWEYLNYLADDLADSVSGLAFYSSSLLPDIPATTALSLLPRLSLDEPSSPHQILLQISLGMDLFVIPFVGAATDEGLALTFRFPQPSPSSIDTVWIQTGDIKNEGEEQLAENSRVEPLAIDLSSAAHAASLAPLLPSCTCYTCSTHHRAFVKHLLSTREMLGWVLLQIHNHNVISSFFVAVRASILRGTFEADKAKFERVYEAALPVGMGQRPRVRGYQFKSEGPGERKKNKPAWGKYGSNGEGGRNRETQGEVDTEKDGEMVLVLDDDPAQEGFADVVGGEN